MSGELVTVAVMAVALSMDAFSIAVGLGLFGMRYRRIAAVGTSVGFFHIVMPLCGLVIGKMLSQYLGVIAIFTGGSGLIIIGLQMIVSSFSKDESPIFSPRGIGLFIFSLSVSMDSFAAGLSLGMLGAQTWLTVGSFGIVSAVFTWAGLILGKKAGHLVGSSGEWIGGLVLIAFGVKMITGVF